MPRRCSGTRLARLLSRRAGELFAAVRNTYHRLDVLVNNAGIATHMNTEDIPLKYEETSASFEARSAPRSYPTKSDIGLIGVKLSGPYYSLPKDELSDAPPRRAGPRAAERRQWTSSCDNPRFVAVPDAGGDLIQEFGAARDQHGPRSAANVSAMARPIPLLAPVTIATLSCDRPGHHDRRSAEETSGRWLSLVCAETTPRGNRLAAAMATGRDFWLVCSPCALQQAFLESRLGDKPLILLARPERFELPAPRFVVWCSVSN
jgi:hypothetical protein